MPKSTRFYDRTPSEELLALLAPGKLLAALTDKDLQVKNLNTPVDVHFRANDWVHVYCGLTRVVDMHLDKNKKGKLRVTAHQTYRNQDCSRHFLQDWDPKDLSFMKEMRRYLERVCVHDRHVKGEGRVQLMWSRVTSDHWVPFDREIRLENQERSQCSELRSAFMELKNLWRKHSRERGKGRWKEPKKTAVKLDQLAVDQEGRLVLIELKAGRTQDYYAPFQLLQYVWEWHRAFQTSPNLLQDVKRLLDARVRAGLTPQPKTPLTGRIRAAVCLGTDERTCEVKRRHNRVLAIVNENLPPGVGDIETWEFKDAPIPVT